MNSRHLVDPQLAPFLAAIPELTLNSETLPALRARPPLFMPDPVDLERTDLHIQAVPGPRGAPDVELFIYRPQHVSGPMPTILHIHGGGYVMGSARAQEAAHRRLVADMNCLIVSVNYRLAPETVFPGSLEDCYAALAWIFANADELAADPARIGVMGESAGGGLAAALALLARDRQEHRLAFQHLIYPMVDDRTCVLPEPHPLAGEFVWTRASNRFGWASMLGHEPGLEGTSHYAAAARAEDLAGLPATYIATGALDLFVDDCLEYARRLIRAGVPTDLRVFAGAFHGFQAAVEADVAKAAMRDAKAALVRAMATASGMAEPS